MDLKLQLFACETPYHMKKMYFGFYDNTAVTPLTLNLTGFVETFPELYDPIMTFEQVDNISQGTHLGTYEGNDVPPDKPEFTISGQIPSSSVASKEVEMVQFLLKKLKAAASTVNSNTDGSTTYLLYDGSDYSSCIPKNLYTFNMMQLNTNGTVAEDHGRLYEKTEIKNLTTNINNNILSYTITGVLHDRHTVIDKTDWDAIFA